MLKLSRSHLDPDWCADKTERPPNLVFQKSLVGKMQLHLAVGEQDECRRRNRRLGQVQDLYSLANGDRSPIEIYVLQETVHLAGGDALPPLRRDLLQ